jgi:hypothetical protein
MCDRGVERLRFRSFQLPDCAFSLPFDSLPLVFQASPCLCPVLVPYPESFGMPIRHYYGYCTLQSPDSSFLKILSHEITSRASVAALRKSIRKKSSRHLLLNLRILHRASGALGILHLGQYFHVAVRPAKTSGAERFPKSYSAWWLNSSACRWRWRWVLPKFRGLELRSSIEPVASLTLGQEVKCNRHPFETKSHRTIEYSTKSQISPT